MVKKIILLLVVILPLCGCNQKVQGTENSENDSIAEFFRKFYVGCNDYYAQSVNVDDSKGKAYCQALQDDFVSFLKNFCCDDIVADVNRMNFDIYGCDIDTLNDSVFGSLYVEKMKYDKNVYIVHLQTDSLHIQRPYTLTKQGGKMKISAIGKRKLPMVFCNDTLWIKDSPQCIDEFNKWHGVAISTNYDVVDSLKLAKDFRVAILSPNFDSWKDAPIPPICSDRLLLVEYKNKQEVYDNVIGNGEPTGGWLPYEMLVKPWEDKTTDFVERSDFILSYGDGNGYKIYYTIVTGETIIVKKEEPNPRNRQLEGAISLGNKEKLLEEENRKDGEASYNPSLETKEIKKNIKGNSSKNQGRNAVTRSAIGIDSIESSKIFDNADEEASFPGGIAACMKYIADNFRYPNIQGDCSIQGKIVVTFTVNEDGNLSDIKVKKSVYSDLDKEAVRVVKSMPSWIPAKQNGKAVKSRYTLPVYIHVQ